MKSEKYKWKSDYIECDCASADHVIRFVYTKYPDEPELYMEVQLHQYRNIFQRIWLAIKYTMGYKSRYGMWDCSCIGINEANKLMEILKIYKEDHEKYIKNPSVELLK